MSPDTPGTTPPRATPPGWHPDPYGRCDLRWWDGSAWTDWGARSGERVHEPAHPGAAPVSGAPTAAAPAAPAATLATPAPAAPTAAPAPAPDKSDRSRILKWGAGALALAVSVAAIAITGGDDGDERETRTGATSATTAANDGGETVAAEWPGRPLTGELGLADVVATKKARVTAAGATISFDGGPVDGLRVAFPEGAYDEGAEIEIAAREITSHTFGELIDPVSPLVSVEGAPGVANGLVEVTLPAPVPDGSFAMGFYYDPDTRRLEGVPPVAQGDGTVTLVTRHFSSVFVSMVLPARLPEAGETMFLAGTDGWQFTNYGSFVSRGGHCAGMSISAMWYWSEQKNGAGAPKLLGRFDDSTGDPTPSFWQDDSQAIRFVSTVQEDVWWGNLVGRFFRYARTVGFDRLQWTAFRYAMTVTGQPQYVTLAYPKADDPTKVGGGHAVVAYAYTSDRLYVYDPNHPRRKRFIRWDDANSRFLPYGSALKAGDEGHDFTWIGFAAKSALTDWAGIGRRYNELLSGTAGNDRFPRYRLLAVEKKPDGTEKLVPLGDGYTTDRRSLTVTIRIAGRDARATAYRGTRKVARAADPKTLTIPLRSGRNDLGFLIEGSEKAWDTWEYVDFTRFRVVRAQPPPPTTTTTTTTRPPATTAPPTTAAPPPIDCSSCPPGLAGVQCRLQCEGIEP